MGQFQRDSKISGYGTRHRTWTQPASFYFCAVLGPPRPVHHQTFATIADSEESSRKSGRVHISSEARSHRPSVVKMSPGGRSQGLFGDFLWPALHANFMHTCLAEKKQTPIAFFSVLCISKMCTWIFRHCMLSNYNHVCASECAESQQLHFIQVY